MVEIEDWRGRQDRIMARFRRYGRALDTAPRHHGRICRDLSFENLVPADQPPAMLRQIGADAGGEPALQRGFVLQAKSLDPRLGARIGLPLVLHRLVATDMD